MLINLLLAFGLALSVVNDAASRRERLNAIEADVAASAAALKDAIAAQRDPDEPNSVIDDLSAQAGQRRRAGLAAALKIAQEDPASDVSLDALQWLVLYGPPEEKSLALLTRFGAANPRLGESGAILHLALHPPYGLPGAQEPSIPRYSPAYPVAMELLNAIVAKNPDRAARGQALIGLALQAKLAYDVYEFRHRPEAEAFRADAEKRFAEIAKDYGDCPAVSAGGTTRWTDANQRVKGAATLGDVARSKLVQLRNFSNLMPGKTAPEIAGEDLDGARFKLSDYRSKVVMLVFWASWCSPCMAEVPHELELINRFKDKPFVLIGINVDDSRTNAQRAIPTRHISWRSFWDNGNGQFGPICTAWDVTSLPTVFVIDEKGIMRHCYIIDGKELDTALDQLVAAAAAKRAER